MDWTVVVSWSALALNALAIGFWKPWLGAYGGEKGKNLARKEDLNEILAEVRATTIAQKSIENTLAGELWTKQTRRSEKKELYADVLAKVHDATRACQNLAHWRRHMGQGLHWSDPHHDIEATLRKELSDYEVAETELIRMVALVKIFLSNAAGETLLAYLKSPRALFLDSELTAISQQQLSLITLSEALVIVAKTDLGLTTP